MKKLLLPLLLIISCNSFAATNKQKSEAYCHEVIGLMTLMFIKAKNSGKKKEVFLPKIIKLPQIRDNKQLKNDVIEVANFVYNEGYSVPDSRVREFLVDEWCLGQINTFRYK